jgi:dsRNA-specific ribonuclease
MARRVQFDREKKYLLESAKEAIGIPNFGQLEFLEIALTHPSYVYERLDIAKSQKDLQEKEYRRLAHLGDAILNAAVTDYLYQKFSQLDQGELTKAKHNLINKTSLAELADKLQLKKFCLLGLSQQENFQARQERLFSEMFESLLGAIYLEFDRDFSRTRTWIVNNYIANAVDGYFDEVENDEIEFDEDDIPSTTVTTREYLDMIGLHDFPDYGWVPGDD